MASLDDREARLRRREEIKAAASAEAAAVTTKGTTAAATKGVAAAAAGARAAGAAAVVKKTPFGEFCELSVQTRECARGAARPSILRSVSPCARAVVLVKDVVRRALDGQIDGQRGCVACLP